MAMPMDSSRNPSRMMVAGLRSPLRFPARIATANMLSDSGASDSPACSALYSRTIWKKIGSAIIAPPSATCWSSWPEIPRRNIFERNRSGSIRASLPARFRRTSHQASSASDTAPMASSAPTASPPSCHTRMPRTRPPMPKTDRTAPTRSMPRSPVYGHVPDPADPGQDDRDDDQLEREADAPRQEGRDEPAEQRADGGRDGGRGADERVDPLLVGALEVAVDERLHRGEQERRAEAAEDRPEDDDRPQVLGEGHRQGADRVAEQAQDVGLLAPDQVADLAADQDERRGDEGLEGDRRLDAAHRGAEVGDDRGDRDVHQGRVDDQDEHRRREQEREPPIELGGRRGGLRRWLRSCGRRCRRCRCRRSRRCAGARPAAHELAGLGDDDDERGQRRC